MVQFFGFTSQEERRIAACLDRLSDDNYRLCELGRIEKADLPGYSGRVVPRPAERSEKWDMTMYLASCDPFTVAHELAHVSDIAVRRDESRDHLALCMPTHWHLAHTMSAEYYANRIASTYAAEPDVFAAFRNDAAGLVKSAIAGDWASFLTYYALLLGIFHAKGQSFADPLQAVPSPGPLPQAVMRILPDFREQAAQFFREYGKPALLAA